MKNKVILIIFSIFLISSVSALNVDDNTVALWNLDEGSGINVIDATGNGNDGTTIGGATWTTDSVSGFALEFDGVDDYVPITKTSSLDVSNEMTVEASVKRTSNTDGMVFSRNGPYYLAVRNNVISGGVFAGSWWEELSGVTPLEQDVWYNLKLTYDGENLNLYVNDVLDASVPKTGLIGPWSQRGYIGYGEPGQNQYFTGVIDEVRISNIARDNSTSEPPQPPEPSCQDRIIELETQVTELTNKVSLLESLVEKLQSYMWFLKNNAKKDFLCSILKETGGIEIIDYGIYCEIKELKKREVCVCKKV